MRNQKWKQSAVAVWMMAAGMVWADYAILDLGSLGGTNGGAEGVNNNMEVVGGASIPTNSTTHAFLYNGVMTDLHSSLGGSNVYSKAHDISDGGLIVGAFDVASSGGSVRHAFLYDNGTVTDLNAVLSASFGYASAVNNDGYVVGQYYDALYTSRAFLYDSATGVVTLPGALGGTLSAAHDINENGDVAGFAQTAGGAMHGFSYSSGVMTDLGTLGGTSSYAWGINDLQDIVGVSYISGDIYTHAFVYSSGVMTDIGTLDGNQSAAMAINNNGDVVGYSDVVSGGATQTAAFLYSGGVMQDLNSLLPPGSGWYLRTANDINDAGVIVGSGIINGENRAYMMGPGC